jgi:hypothetical protein
MSINGALPTLVDRRCHLGIRLAPQSLIVGPRKRAANHAATSNLNAYKDP